ADRGQQHAADAHGAGLGRPVQALEELRQLQQAEGAQQHEERAGGQQQHQGDGDDPAHSTISLRSTYLLSTTELTKPSMAMISATTKYTAGSRRIPSRITREKAATESVSRARIRSGTVGPRSSRYSAISIARAVTCMVATIAQPTSACGVTGRSPS